MNEKQPRKSMYGGYPFDGIKTKEVFPNRIPTKIVEERVFADISDEHYPQWAKAETERDKNDFWMNRLHDANTALGIAENQIKDMLADYPFIPEEMGLEEHQDSPIIINDKPCRMYSKNGWTIVRVEDHTWLAQTPEVSGQMSSVFHFELPTAQVAFFVLRSIGMISDEDFEKEEEFWAHSIELTDEEKAKIKKGKAEWSEEKNRFVIPAVEPYPQELWHKEIATEEFDYLEEHKRQEKPKEKFTIKNSGDYSRARGRIAFLERAGEHISDHLKNEIVTLLEMCGDYEKNLAEKGKEEEEA